MNSLRQHVWRLLPYNSARRIFIIACFRLSYQEQRPRETVLKRVREFRR